MKNKFLLGAISMVALYFVYITYSAHKLKESIITAEDNQESLLYPCSNSFECDKYVARSPAASIKPDAPKLLVRKKPKIKIMTIKGLDMNELKKKLSDSSSSDGSDSDDAIREEENTSDSWPSDKDINIGEDEEFYNPVCPSQNKDWFNATNDMIKNLTNPEKISIVSNYVRRCEADNDFLVLNRCLEKLKKLEKVIDSWDHLGVLKKSRPTKTVELPRAFMSEEFFETVSNSVSKQEEIDKVMKDLRANLPKGSSTMQFTSTALSGNVRSFSTRIPTADGHLSVHYHSDISRYLMARSVKKEDGKPLKNPKLDFFASSTNGHAEMRDERCVSCHRGAEPHISPKDGSVISHDPKYKDNEILGQFNSTRTVGADISNLTFDHLGPPIGPEKPYWRNVKFINSCTDLVEPKLSNPEKGQVNEAMNCVGCHNSKNAGTHQIRYPFHISSFGFRIFDNLILSGGMPSHQKIPLNKNVRRALVDCLKYEYFGGFKSKKYSRGNKKPGILMNSLLMKKGCDENLDFNSEGDCRNCNSKGKN